MSATIATASVYASGTATWPNRMSIHHATTSCAAPSQISVLRYRRGRAGLGAAPPRTPPPPPADTAPRGSDPAAAGGPRTAPAYQVGPAPGLFLLARRPGRCG